MGNRVRIMVAAAVLVVAGCAKEPIEWGEIPIGRRAWEIPIPGARS